MTDRRAVTACRSGALVKVFGWYDNEWGCTNPLVEVSLLLADAE